MATRQQTVDFILDQIGAAGSVSARKMFGEYTIYCDGKIVAFAADDKLFVKPTPAGRAHASEVSEAPPYPGGKPCLLIEPDLWDDVDWLTQLIRVSAAQLPAPAPKAPKAKAPKKTSPKA
jgi:TfoX/Sxy family transcriptional regulator of competence genes